MKWNPKYAFVLLFFLSFSYLGCSSLETYPVKEKISPKKDRKFLAEDFKMAILPLEVLYKPTKELKNPEQYNVEVEKNKFLAKLTQYLVKYPIFPKGKLRFYPPKEGYKFADYMKQAWKDKQDLLMVCKLRKYQLSYRGVHTGLYLLNLFTWFYLWFPSWWIADEIYLGEMEWETSIYSVHSGKMIWSTVIREKREDYLNDWQRGWKIFGIFTVPSYLSKGNWRDIRASMAPWLEEKVGAELWLRLYHQFLPYLKSPKYWKATQKTLVLSLGISSYKDPEIPSNKINGSNDGLAFYQFFKPKVRKSLFLFENQVNQKKVFQALQNFFIPYGKKQDILIFYFAGFGATLRTQKGVDFFLIPYEAEIDRLRETSISLTRLLSTLKKVKAKRIWLILDTSLGGSLTESSLYGRSLTQKWNIRYLRSRREQEISQNEILQGMKIVQNLPSHIKLLLACHPQEDCFELEENKRGLFNFLLLQKLQNQKNKDWNQVLSTLAYRVLSFSRKYGQPQHLQVIPHISEREIFYFESLPLQ